MAKSVYVTVLIALGDMWSNYVLVADLVTCVFVFCFGAIVGSFLNVVIYRLPEGMSIISPPSRCPTCGFRLTWRDNLPVVGWLVLRGKCRKCKASISPQYVVIELIVALMFVGVFLALYVIPLHTPWIGAISSRWWHDNDIWRTLPAFIMLVLLFAGLIAMTVIDARTFMIPMQIPMFLMVIGLLGSGMQSLLPVRASLLDAWFLPAPDWTWSLASLLGMTGVLISCALLRFNVLRRSFGDYEDYVKEGEALAEYPHARREMLPELLFLLPIVLGFFAGWFLGNHVAPATGNAHPPRLLAAVAGSCAGYLAGGGIVWAVRILGTLAFGKEAMGMGDVHLLAAVGVIMGWFEPLTAFFIAPFIALSWVLIATVLRLREGRHLPFGPHLAIATMIIFFCRPTIQQILQAYFGPIAAAESGFHPM